MTLPLTIETSVNAAVNLLIGKLQCSTTTAKTHQVVFVEGWAGDADTIKAIGIYLVGLLASTISTTLAVRASIENTDMDKLELLKNVTAITGTSASPLSESKRQDERNPWIAEGLWHLCLFISSRRTEVHPMGQVIALDQPHIGAKDHGFDVIALYETKAGEFGMSIVECKAYEKDVNGAIGSAVTFFRAFDNGEHDTRIRQVVAQMRDLLPGPKQKSISPSLWKSIRSYVPNPHYDAQWVTDWNNARPSFGSLGFPVIVMPHAVPDFTKFFDQVGDAMMDFVLSVSRV